MEKTSHLPQICILYSKNSPVEQQQTAEVHPKVSPGKGKRPPVFDLLKLFGDCMEMGRSYLEEDIRKRIKETANILTNKMCNKVFQNAVSQKVIFRDEKQPDKKAYFRPILQEIIQFS